LIKNRNVRSSQAKSSALSGWLTSTQASSCSATWSVSISPSALPIASDAGKAQLLAETAQLSQPTATRIRLSLSATGGRIA
jgi:hypothetical protein